MSRTVLHLNIKVIAFQFDWLITITIVKICYGIIVNQNDLNVVSVTETISSGALLKHNVLFGF